MSLQIVSVIGNATKDADVKTSKDGVSYVTFRLAVGGGDGATTFYNVLVFGKYGEVMQEHITRGRQIFVTGKVQISEKGYISVVADHLELLARPRPKEKKEEKPAAGKTEAKSS
jgi:single-stranded DNA-binding protein